LFLKGDDDLANLLRNKKLLVTVFMETERSGFQFDFDIFLDLLGDLLRDLLCGVLQCVSLELCILILRFKFYFHI
jgi:hypothetical protein